MNKKRKVIYIIGCEKSGSKFISRIVAHVLGACEYENWDGVGLCDSKNNCIVAHFSQPHCNPPEYSDIKSIENQYKDDDLRFVITTRDITISENSRLETWWFHKHKTKENVAKESNEAKKIIEYILTNHDYFIWSYETMNYLRQSYLEVLYKWLGVTSKAHFKIIDGNKKYIKK
jgi:hypothetical protein